MNAALTALPLTQQTYRAHLVDTASALYSAARHEGTLHRRDLDVVLTGRRALLGLLLTIHQDLTGIADSLLAIRPHDIEAHPVESLGRALRRYPRPTGALAPTDVAQVTPKTEAGAAWQKVARHATIAQHAWTTGEHQQFAPDMQWAGIADVASLADVLTRLDVGLMVWTASQKEQRALTSALRSGLHLALGVCARETLLLASRGPLPDVGPDRAPLPSLEVLPVSRHDDLPVAQLRLATLLERGGPLRPERFPSLAAIQAGACLLLAETLQHTWPQGPTPVNAVALGEALRRHANALRAATTRRNSIASYLPGDGRAMRQATEIGRMLQHEPQIVTGDAALLTDVVHGIAGTTRALATAASRALETGNWLVPNHRASLTQPLWNAWQSSDPVPSPVTAIRKAVANSVELTQSLAPPTPAPLVSGQRPRPAMSIRGQRITLPNGRPALPGYSPTPASARHR